MHLNFMPDDYLTHQFEAFWKNIEGDKDFIEAQKQKVKSMCLHWYSIGKRREEAETTPEKIEATLK